jgi:hypothetical protein
MAYINNQLKNNHYVYVLRDSDMAVRYVGEGRVNRWKQKSGRSDNYLRVLNTGGTIEIVCRNLTKNESCEMEKYFIKKYEDTIFNVQKQTSVKNIEFQKLKELFIIDANSISGLSWKKKIRNVRGTKAGSVNGQGYYSVSYGSSHYKVHRIVWCLYNGIDLNSNLVVHHIDGTPSNNSPLNLQAVSQLENVNRKINISKDSKLLGVSVHSKRGNENSRLVITFYQDDVRFSKEFSLNKYSYDVALSMALDWKEAKIKDIKNV